MRAPDDMPQRRRRSRGTRVPGRGRIILLVVAAALFVLLMSLRGLANVYTDYLWFDSLHFGGIWRRIVGTKFALGATFTAIFFVLCFVNLTIADRIAPKFRPSGPEDDLLNRYHQVIDRRAGLVRAGVSLLFGLIAGVGVSAQWNQWLLFRNGGSFGTSDATFGTDIGFYVFKLPFITAVVDWLFASLVIILLIVVVAHYLNGGIRMQSPFQRVTPQVKAHLSVLLALLALVKAVDYWFGRYELTYSTRGYVDGATYTDVKAQLPATYLLLLISLLSCALFIVNIWRRGWVLPVVAVGLWFFVQIVAGAIYPMFIQRVVVEPEESSKEAPYIDHNIQATQAAMNLNNVNVQPFDYQDTTAAGRTAVEQNPQTIRNIRLLDPDVVSESFKTLQSIKSYYQFSDLDVDRYEITPNAGGTPEKTQVILGARDLNVSEIPQQSWEGSHIAYTHGYGLALSPANATTSDGTPNFLVKDVPMSVENQQQDPSSAQVDTFVSDPPVPQLYFGEHLPGYAIVDTTRTEVDYLDKDGQIVPTDYSGSGGVSLDSPLRRGAFFLRFNFEWNLLLSNFVTPQSKVLYNRDVRQRVHEVAPFLQLDADPYPVVADGRVQYIVDAYTTTDRYPNAQRAVTDGLTAGSGLDGHRFNYVRNSVKAVVDAYDGTVKLYIVDPNDPIVRAYQRAFPNLFEDGAMPSSLQAHWRYPEDLFRVQTNMFGRYHLNDARSFYDNTNAWAVAQDPGTKVSTGTAAQNTPSTLTPSGETVKTLSPRIAPYYLLMNLPDQQSTDPKFVMLRSFVPYSSDDSNKLLTALMVANSEPGPDYGKLSVYQMTRGDVQGPAQVNAKIQADGDVAAQIQRLSQSTTVSYGNMLLIPINNTILYVRPLYATSQGATQVPKLNQVIVVYGEQVVMKPTLKEALQDLFPGVDVTTFENQQGTTPPSTTTPPSDGSSTTTTTTPQGEPSDQSVQDLLSQADQLFTEANDALKNGGADGLATYQEKMAQAQDLVRQALEKSANTSSTTTTTAPQGET